LPPCEYSSYATLLLQPVSCGEQARGKGRALTGAWPVDCGHTLEPPLQSTNHVTIRLSARNNMIIIRQYLFRPMFKFLLQV